MKPTTNPPMETTVRTMSESPSAPTVFTNAAHTVDGTGSKYVVTDDGDDGARRD